MFGFDGDKPTPANPDAIEYFDLLTEALSCKDTLDKALAKIPDYTGQWQQEDYCGYEREYYFRAADALWDFVNKKHQYIKNG